MKMHSFGSLQLHLKLQWKYITANSCSPPGYAEYFAGRNSKNEPQPANFWNSQVPDCVPPYPNDGARSDVWPEQFFNCAEGKIDSLLSTFQKACCSALTFRFLFSYNH